MGRKPPQVSVAEYVASAISRSGKSNAQIAEEIGYPAVRANLISMIRTNRSKLPINKVALFAKAVHVDPVHLISLVLAEYSPDTYEALAPFLGTSMTEGEAEVLNVLRHEANGLPIKLNDSDLVTLQGMAREASKVARSEQKKGVDLARKNWEGKSIDLGSRFKPA
jgi:hypothetical protein